MPQKHEHVVTCRLSKRQRALYEEYMSRADTKATLATGNFLGVISCLMQLRKVMETLADSGKVTFATCTVHVHWLQS